MMKTLEKVKDSGILDNKAAKKTDDITDIDISYSYGFTADARQKLTREMKCNTCGKTIRDSASEDLPESAIWR
jgi:hypothetical protein